MKAIEAKNNNTCALPGLKTAVLAAVLVVGLLLTAALLSGCGLGQQRYDLSRPVNTHDWLMVWEDPDEVTDGAIQVPDYRIRAGDPIFELDAPFENYIEIATLGAGGRDESRSGTSSIDDWVVREAAIRYFLPLYDDGGQLVRTLLVWREQHTALIAHSFDEGYQSYLATKDELTSYLIGTYGNAYKHSEYRIYWTWIGALVFAENSQGSFGQFFVGDDTFTDYDLPYDFASVEGQVLPEAEIVRILYALYNFDPYSELRSENGIADQY